MPERPPRLPAPAEATPGRGAVLALGLVAAMVPSLAFAWVELPLQANAVLSLVYMAVGTWVASRAPKWRVAVAVLSLTVSARYLVWRGTDTISFDHPGDAVSGVLLYTAELYGFVIMVAGYFQTSLLLRRRPVPLPADPRELPTVDVWVPTYNESVDILRRTLVGACAIDYPKKTVWLLDDGNRPEMEALAAELGVGYLTRPDNRHAKAGNLNAALGRTHGELIAVFDADHVPVRSFLALTVGFFLKDRGLALVQTPHHFYNPDPFERNLWIQGRVPPEQAMFYHVVQPGNDFWNAAFYCGSCAVLRRTSLEAVGGFAVETVTEDAHTALKLHASGWRSAYLDIPLAAGLATERYAFHIVQRTRWARGMTQILRLDNPLFKRGLTLPQRINYLNAILHFQFGLPRLMYSVSPALFLLWGVHPIAANPWEVLAYAAPHVLLSVVAGSATSRSARHAFWAEVFETAVAPFTAATTVATLIWPYRGKFNVTTKGVRGGAIDFDWRHAAPNLFVLSFILAGVVITPRRWLDHPLEHDSTLLTALWNVYNLAVLLAALSVALERPDRRNIHRVRAEYPVLLQGPAAAPYGGVVEAVTADLSEEGAAVLTTLPAALGDEFTVSIRSDFTHVEGLRARVVGRQGHQIRLFFVEASSEQIRRVIELMFTHPRTWMAAPIEAHPLGSLGSVISTPWRSFSRTLREGG